MEESKLLYMRKEKYSHSKRKTLNFIGIAEVGLWTVNMSRKRVFL